MFKDMCKGALLYIVLTIIVFLLLLGIQTCFGQYSAMPPIPTGGPYITPRYYSYSPLPGIVMMPYDTFNYYRNPAPPIVIMPPTYVQPIYPYYNYYAPRYYAPVYRPEYRYHGQFLRK